MDSLNRSIQLKIAGDEKLPIFRPRYAILSGNRSVVFGVYELHQAAQLGLHTFSRNARVLKELGPYLFNLETGEITNG